MKRISGSGRVAFGVWRLHHLAKREGWVSVLPKCVERRAFSSLNGRQEHNDQNRNLMEKTGKQPI